MFKGLPFRVVRVDYARCLADMNVEPEPESEPSPEQQALKKLKQQRPARELAGAKPWWERAQENKARKEAGEPPLPKGLCLKI